MDHETRKTRYDEFEETIEDLCSQYPKEQAVSLVGYLTNRFGSERVSEWAAMIPEVLLEAYIDQHRGSLAEWSNERGPTAEVHDLSMKRREKE